MQLYSWDTGCSLNIVFFSKILKYSGLLHRRCSRTDRVQKNHKIWRKNTIIKEHPVVMGPFISPGPQTCYTGTFTIVLYVTIYYRGLKPFPNHFISGPGWKRLTRTLKQLQRWVVKGFIQHQQQRYLQLLYCCLFFGTETSGLTRSYLFLHSLILVIIWSKWKVVCFHLNFYTVLLFFPLHPLDCVGCSSGWGQGGAHPALLIPLHPLQQQQVSV